VICHTLHDCVHSQYPTEPLGATTVHPVGSVSSVGARRRVPATALRPAVEGPRPRLLTVLAGLGWRRAWGGRGFGAGPPSAVVVAGGVDRRARSADGHPRVAWERRRARRQCTCV